MKPIVIQYGSRDARVAELADALDSGSSERLVHGGSSPPPRTIWKTVGFCQRSFAIPVRSYRISLVG